MIASVERYSIKDLEPFFGYARKQDLADASMSRRIVEHAIEAGDLDEHSGRRTGASSRTTTARTASPRNASAIGSSSCAAKAIAAGQRADPARTGDGSASDEISDLDRELQRFATACWRDVPEDATKRSEEQHARFVLAHMMEFHRREDKAGWWEYFRVLDLDEEEYADERRAIDGTEFKETLSSDKGAVAALRLSAPQELDARRRDDVYDTEGTKIGAVEDGQLRAANHRHQEEKVICSDCTLPASFF